MKPSFWASLLTDGSLARIVVAGLCVVLVAATTIPQPLVDAVTNGRNAQTVAERLAAFSEAAAYAPYNTDHVLALAEAQAQAGETDQAIAFYVGVSEKGDLAWQDWQQLGTLYASIGDTEAAIGAWEQARVLGSNDRTFQADGIFTALTAAYIQQDDWSRVQAILAALNTYNPLRADYRYQLGLVQALNGFDEAGITLAETVALDPTYARQLAPLQAFIDQRESYAPDEGYQQLGAIYLGLGELELARAAFDRAVLINPTYSQAMAYRSLTSIQLGDTDLAGVQQAVRLAPDNTEVLIVSGLAWREAGEAFGARALFEQAYQLDPLNPAVAVEIASTYRAEDNLLAAEVWMIEAARLAPDDPRFQVLLAQFYLDENYQVANVALPLARELAAAYPDNADAQTTLGQALFQVEDHSDAINQLGLAIMLDFRSARAQYFLGQAYQAEGSLSAARGQYEEVIQNFPGTGFAAAAQRSLERLPGG